MGVKDTAEESVLQHRAGGVLTLTLNRPERRNAVDDATANVLHERVRAVHDDPDCQVIVIDGAGPSFCAGWDVEAATALRALPVAAVEAVFERNRVLLEDLESAPQVTVAAVHGAVMGFGLGLVARCDIALAAESTLVALPEIAHRIVPAIVMVDLLETLPEKVALDWLLSGERRTADDALAAALFSRVVPDDELQSAVAELARALAAHDSTTLRETKALYRRLQGLDRSAAVREAIATAAAALSDGGS